jgi:hypothetical protein
VVELALQGAKTSFDVTQTFSVGQLCKRHGEKLIPTGEVLHVVTAMVAGRALLKLLMRQMLDQLREDGLADVHGPLSQAPRTPPKPSFSAKVNSNRSRLQR